MIGEIIPESCIHLCEEPEDLQEAFESSTSATTVSQHAARMQSVVQTLSICCSQEFERVSLIKLSSYILHNTER